MYKPLLAKTAQVGVTCPRRADTRLLALAFTGPCDYGTKFPPLFIIPRWRKLLGSAIILLLVVLATTVCKGALLLEVGLTPSQLLKFLSLPVVSVLFTYSHIWLALWMTFYPTEFFGVPGVQIPESPFGLGWQGIVPSKVRKMSATFIHTLTTQLMTLEEMFARIQPDLLLDELDGPLSSALAQVIDELGVEEAPQLWQSMPDIVKQELVLRMSEEFPQTVADLVNRIQTDLSNVFDIHEYVVKACCKDKPLFNHCFIQCGYPELEFIRDTGACMGLFFGIVQMLQQFFYPAGWLLPVFGVVVGLFTNWIAIKMCFEPVYPKSLLGGRVVLQGCFLKRQREVAPLYAKFFAEHVGCSRKLIPAAVVGRCSDQLCRVVADELDKAIDRCADVLQPVIAASGSKTSYLHFKQLAITKVADILPTVFMNAQTYLDKAMNVEGTIAERVSAMDVKDFEQLLHPIFKEDEWLLILVGGILGYVVGSLQWYVLGS